MARYNVTLNRRMERNLSDTSDELEIPKSEVMRRAIELYHHVVTESDSNSVEILNKDGQKVRLIIR